MKRWLPLLVVMGASTLYFGHAFRLLSCTLTSFGLVDCIDPYFINSLLEHWYRSVSRLADPGSPPMFFPAAGTLGYSHGLILYAPFYLLVRPFTHPFAAYTLTLFLVMNVGAISLLGVFRRFVSLGVLESVVLVAWFVASPNVMSAYIGTWSQVASVFLVPPILLLGLDGAARPPGGKRTIRLALAGVLSTLLFMQDFSSG